MPSLLVRFGELTGKETLYLSSYQLNRHLLRFCKWGAMGKKFLSIKHFELDWGGNGDRLLYAVYCRFRVRSKESGVGRLRDRG
jgi:hypothetical protein